MKTGKLEVLETVTTGILPISREDGHVIDDIEGMGQYELNLRGVENTREYPRLCEEIKNEIRVVSVESDGYYWMNGGVCYSVKEEDDTEELHKTVREIVEEFLEEACEIMARDPNFVSEEVETALDAMKGRT